jgi:hypothetical protein
MTLVPVWAFIVCSGVNFTLLKIVLLVCKNSDFFTTRKSGCTLDVTDFTNMATGHSCISLAAELNSSVPCKIAAPVSPREGYPELPGLSDNPHPYSTVLCSGSRIYSVLFYIPDDGRKRPRHVVYNVLHNGINRVVIYSFFFQWLGSPLGA